MGRIVAIAALSHAPGLTGWPDRATAEERESLYKGFAEVGRQLRAAKPNVIVGIANDHLLNFPLSNVPDFCIGTAPHWKGPAEWFRDWLNVPPYSLKGHADLAKILVREGALLIDARQLNKNLLLSSDATVNTKPQLEIFADDVKCAHGATVGQLEEDELFYLASRGLAPEKARALLTYGFAEDVIGKIRLQSVRKQLDRMALDKLHQSLEVA